MTPKYITYNIFILQSMPVNILIPSRSFISCCISILLSLIEKWYVHLALYTYFIIVELLALCSFNVRRIFFGLTIDFVISPIIIFSSLVSQPTYGYPTNDLANAWLWLPHINFTIYLSPPTTDFPSQLKRTPTFFTVSNLLELLSLWCYSTSALSRASNIKW